MVAAKGGDLNKCKKKLKKLRKNANKYRLQESMIME
jgi:hypothetical protein